MPTSIDSRVALRLALCLVVVASLQLGAPACDDAGTTATPDATATADATADATASLTLAATFDPDPPVSGQNHLALTLTDASGHGVAGAAITVVPTMPAMGHGSTETPVVSDDGDGHYTAFPVTFQMPGSWKVAVEATTAAGSARLDLSVTVR